VEKEWTTMLPRPKLSKRGKKTCPGGKKKLTTEYTSKERRKLTTPNEDGNVEGVT